MMHNAYPNEKSNIVVMEDWEDGYYEAYAGPAVWKHTKDYGWGKGKKFVVFFIFTAEWHHYNSQYMTARNWLWSSDATSHLAVATSIYW